MQIAEGTAQQERVILKPMESNSVDQAGLLTSTVTKVFKESREGGEKVKINGAWTGGG